MGCQNSVHAADQPTCRQESSFCTPQGRRPDHLHLAMPIEHRGVTGSRFRHKDDREAVRLRRDLTCPLHAHALIPQSAAPPLRRIPSGRGPLTFLSQEVTFQLGGELVTGTGRDRPTQIVFTGVSSPRGPRLDRRTARSRPRVRPPACRHPRSLRAAPSRATVQARATGASITSSQLFE